MAVGRDKNSAKETALALGREERAGKVLDMALDGMSWVAIGKALGVSRETARQDVLRANRSALEKRDELAEKMIAMMSANLQESINFSMSIIERVENEIARVIADENSKRDLSEIERRGLLAADRLDRATHRFASLTGLYPHDGGGNKLFVQGSATITIELPGQARETNTAHNGKVITIPKGDYHAE